MFTRSGFRAFWRSTALTSCIFASATPAFADEEIAANEPAEIEQNPHDIGLPTEEGATDRDTLEPHLRGVALTDIGTPDAKMVAGYLSMKGVLPVEEIFSISAVETYNNRLVVDVVGRAKRFVDFDDHKNAKGRVGVMRVTVPIASAEDLCDVGQPETLWEKSLADLNLNYRVSIGDWIGVVEDPSIGFRRVWPLAGGAIDRGVRVVGVLTSMTPTTEDGLLEKTYAWRELHSPWYFKKKPYLPISVASTFKKVDGTIGKYYHESNIAFHIWQDKGFERGFFSHGCMRMRTEDLAELAAYVFGAHDDHPIPVQVRTSRMKDATHPFPTETKVYWQLKNYGTAEKPKTRLKYMLYETELGTEPLPSPDDLVPLGFNEKPVNDTELGVR